MPCTLYSSNQTNLASRHHINNLYCKNIEDCGVCFMSDYTSLIDDTNSIEKDWVVDDSNFVSLHQSMGGEVGGLDDSELGIAEELCSISEAEQMYQYALEIKDNAWSHDQSEFDWDGRSQLLANTQVSDDYLESLGHSGLNTCASDQNFRNLSAPELYVADLPKLSFEPFEPGLMNLDLPFMNSGDFYTDFLSKFDTSSNRSSSNTCDVPQSPGSTTASNIGPSPDPKQMQVPFALADTYGPQRFYCVVSGCGKHYKRKHELKRHQKSHLGVKPHLCNFSGCNRSGNNGFARRDHLRQHMRKAHGSNLL